MTKLSEKKSCRHYFYDSNIALQRTLWITYPVSCRLKMLYVLSFALYYVDMGKPLYFRA